MTLRDIIRFGIENDPWMPVALVVGLFAWAAAWVMLP